jgi:hypothetical protein
VIVKAHLHVHVRRAKNAISYSVGQIFIQGCSRKYFNNENIKNVHHQNFTLFLQMSGVTKNPHAKTARVSVFFLQLNYAVSFVP